MSTSSLTFKYTRFVKCDFVSKFQKHIPSNTIPLLKWRPWSAKQICVAKTIEMVG